jgi:Asp-tRNA(Asn)/Glu-tRNA(Gln) amidotransferase A subunit family amidase
MYTSTARLDEALHALQEGQHSLTLYVEQQCMRIEKVNPHLAALLPEAERAERLRKDAIELRKRNPDPRQRPPLYGAFVGIKDIIHVDGFETRGGSNVPAETMQGQEAAAVRLLRQAGALIAGKTVTTEFAYVEPGPTRNPHNLEHTPGGSSSGSAAAVAAGLCTLALGTQTIGSVIRPAAYCGVVGFKPSFGRIPTDGILYFSRSADHIGLFTQDVAGMARAAAALCRDWRSIPSPAQLPVLGVPDGPYLAQTEAEALRQFEEQLLMLQVAGVLVKRVPVLDEIEDLNRLHRRMVFAEFAHEHADRFAEYGHLYRPRTAEAIRTGQSVSGDELEMARANRLRLRRKLEVTMREAEIDLWVCPSATGPAPAGLDFTGDANMNLPWTHTGMPAATIPAGRAENGLPLGIQLAAKVGADEELLAWAAMVAGRIAEPADE